MSSFIANTLLNDLIILSNESKKKHPEIKEAADRLSYYLRTLKDKNAASPNGSDLMNNELQQSDEVLKPFLLSCESKNTKLLSIGIQCIQRLLQAKLITPNSLSAVLKVMFDIAGQGMDLQLKVLQSILPLIDTYTQEIHNELLADVFQICFKLSDSKFPVVSNTAAATVRQLVVLIFDKIKIEDDSIGVTGGSCDQRPSLHDAIILLQDLCSLLSEEPAILLKLTSLPKSLVIELMESIFTNHHLIVKSHEILSSILKKKIAPLIIKQFAEKNDFPNLVRVLRLSQVLIKQYHDILGPECKTLISLYMRLIDANSNLTWPCSLVFEAIRDICLDFATLKSIFKNIDSNDDQIKSISSLISSLQKCAFENLGPLNAKRMQDLKDVEPFQFSFTTNTIKVSCLEQLEKSEAPITSEFYSFYLVITSISSLIDGLSMNCLQYISKGDKFLETNNVTDYQLMITFVRCNWANILNVLSLLMTAPLDDDVFSVILNSLERLTIVVGLLELPIERDACIFVICKACIPGLKPNDVIAPATFSIGLSKIQTNAQLTDRNVVCVKALINVTLNLSSTLQTTSFVMILDFLQCTDAMITNGKLEKSNAESPMKSNARVQSKMDNSFMSVITSIKKLLDSCLDLKQDAFQNLVEAFCVIIKETNINTFFNKEKSVEDKNFGVTKLQILLLGDLNRFTESQDFSLWIKTTDLVVELLHQPKISLTLRSQICTLFLEFIVGTIQVSSISENQILQKILLAPIQKLMISNQCDRESQEIDKTVNDFSWFIDLQRCGLDTLNKVIETSGQNLVFGWPMMFDILKSSSLRSDLNRNQKHEQIYSLLGIQSIDEYLQYNDSSTKDFLPNVQLIRSAFSSIQLICNDFLAILDASTLYSCIEALGSLGSQDADLNVSLTAIGLLWTVSDHVLSRRQNLPSPPSTTFTNGNKYVDVDLKGNQSTLTMDALWISILAFLSILSSDYRPEVRNSASQTLFRSININGARLTLDSWEECVLNILLPLIKRVHTYSESAINTKEVDIEEDEIKPRVMVHHSRNSASKQWDETKMLVLNGIFKVVGDHLFVLDKIPGLFDTTWPVVIEFAKIWIINGTLEVALSTVKHLKILIRVPICSNTEETILYQSNERLSRISCLWKQLWEMWVNIVYEFKVMDDVSLTKHEFKHNQFICFSPVHHKGHFAQELLTSFLGLSIDIYQILKTEFSTRKLLHLFQSTLDLIAFQTVIPMTSDNRHRIEVKDIETLTPLQTVGFDLMFSNTQHYHHIDGYQEILLSSMATLITFAFKKEQQLFNSYNALSKIAISLIVGLFESCEKRIELYDTGVYVYIIDCFTVPMSKKYAYPPIGKDLTPLWKYATNAFMTLVKQGLLSLDEKRGINVDIIHDIYNRLFQTMESYLLFENINSCSPGDALSNEEFDMSVLTVIESEIVQYMNRKYIAPSHIESLVGIYDKGSVFYTINREDDAYNLTGVCREKFAKASLQLLFASCSVTRKDSKEARLKIAKVSAPFLIQKASICIQNFIDEKRRSRMVPLSNLKYEELKNIIEHLSMLDLIPFILVTGEFELKDTWQSRINHGQKAHLFVLYPLLVELLTSFALLSCELDTDTVGFIRDCLLKAGKELNLSEISNQI